MALLLFVSVNSWFAYHSNQWTWRELSLMSECNWFLFLFAHTRVSRYTFGISWDLMCLSRQMTSLWFWSESRASSRIMGWGMHECVSSFCDIKGLMKNESPASNRVVCFEGIESSCLDIVFPGLGFPVYSDKWKSQWETLWPIFFFSSMDSISSQIITGFLTCMSKVMPPVIAMRKKSRVNKLDEEAWEKEESDFLAGGGSLRECEAKGIDACLDSWRLWLRCGLWRIWPLCPTLMELGSEETGDNFSTCRSFGSSAEVWRQEVDDEHRGKEHEEEHTTKNKEERTTLVKNGLRSTIRTCVIYKEKWGERNEMTETTFNLQREIKVAKVLPKQRETRSEHSLYCTFVLQIPKKRQEAAESSSYSFPSTKWDGNSRLKEQ